MLFLLMCFDCTCLYMVEKFLSFFFCCSHNFSPFTEGVYNVQERIQFSRVEVSLFLCGADIRCSCECQVAWTQENLVAVVQNIVLCQCKGTKVVKQGSGRPITQAPDVRVFWCKIPKQGKPGFLTCRRGLCWLGPRNKILSFLVLIASSRYLGLVSQMVQADFSWGSS